MVRYYCALALLQLLQACELTKYTLSFKDDNCVRQKIITVNVTGCQGHSGSYSEPIKKRITKRLPNHSILLPKESCTCCAKVDVRGFKGYNENNSEPTRKLASVRGTLLPEKTCECCRMAEWERQKIAIRKCRRGHKGGKRTIYYETISALACACHNCGQDTVCGSN